MMTNKPIESSAHKKTIHSFWKWIGIAMLALCLTIIVSGYWVLGTPTGFQRLLSSIVKMSDGAVEIDGASGTIQSLQINRLQVQQENFRLIVHRMKFEWVPVALFSRLLQINEISAGNVDIYTAESQQEETTKNTLPDSLAIPIDVLVNKFQIDKVAIYSLKDINAEKSTSPNHTVSNILIRLESNAQVHRLQHLAVDSELGALSVSGQIGTGRPFDLAAKIELNGLAKWGMTQVELTGQLEQIVVDLKHHHGETQAQINAQLRPFEAKQVVTALEVVVDKFNIANYATDALQTDLSLQTTLNKNKEAQLVGHLHLKNHAIKPLDEDGLPFSEVSTGILISDEVAKLQDLKLNFPQNGVIAGVLAWHLNQSNGSAALKISQLNPAAIDTRIQALKINGDIKAEGDLQSQYANMQLTGNDFNLDLKVANQANTISLENLKLRHGQSMLVGQGAFSLKDEQAINFSGQLKQFNLASFLKTPESNLNAEIAFNGRLSPEFSGTVNYLFKDSHFNKQPVTGNGLLAFQQPNHLKSDAKLQIGSNKLMMKGGFGRPGDALQLSVSAPALAQVGLGFAGTLHTQLDLKGTMDAPMLDFNIDSNKLTLPGKQSVDSIAAKGQFKNDVLALALTLKDYQKEHKTQLQKLELNISGKKSAHTIQTNIALNDELEAALQAKGAIQQKRPSESFSWDGHINQLSVSGKIPVRLQTPAKLSLSTDKAVLGQTQFAVAGGSVNIVGVNWTPKNWNTQGRFDHIALHYGNEDIPKDDMLHVGGLWNLASKNVLMGEIRIAREKGDWYLPGESPYPIGLKTLVVAVHAKNQRINGQLEFLSEKIGKASAHAALPLTKLEDGGPFLPQAAIDGDVMLDIADLSVINNLAGDMMRVSGSLDVNSKISGTLETPQLNGKIQGKELALALIDQGLDLQQGELSAELDQSAIRITRLNFISPYMPPPKDMLLDRLKLSNQAGELNVVGTLDFTDSRYQLKTTLDRISVMQPNQYWIVTSGDIDVQFMADTLALGGKITADAGLITQPPASQPKLADDVIFVEDKASAEKPSQLVNLNILLDLGKQFFIRASGLEGRLDGTLKLASSAEQPLNATGSIAARDTKFKAYGQDLTVERGMVNFYGPLDDPGLNVLAIRKGLEVEAGVEVTGSVRQPKVKLVSTPTVPDMDKLSWITLGRAPSSGGVDTSLLFAAASSIFGGESGFTNQIRDALGVDEFSLKQGSTTGSSSGSPLASQIGMVGKRLSSQLYLSYERGITSTSAGIAKLTYNLTPSISVVTQAGDDSAADVFYTFKFN